MKKVLSLILSLTMLCTGLTVFSLTASAAEIQMPNNSGNSNVTLEASVIPTPTYAVTIPGKIEFGDVTKKVKNDDAIVKTAVQELIIKHSYLFDNQKNINISLNTDNKIVKGNSNISYNLFEKGTTDKEIVNGTIIFSAQPTSSTVNDTQTKSIYATLDQSLIKAEGDYQGTITFTISLDDRP